MIKIGDNDIKICLGDNEVSKIYIGDNLVYENNPQPDYSQMYLTFEIVSGGGITWKTSSTGITNTISYSINNDEWNNITSSTAGTSFNVNAGDKVRFKGDNSSFFIALMGNSKFESTATFNVCGNIQSLAYNDNFYNNLTAIPYGGLFSNITGLISAENLVLPATELVERCYIQMFRGCTSLTQAPELPATTLVQSCYEMMFYNCTSLTTAPELPAQDIKQSSCYRGMFMNASSLNYVKCLADKPSSSNSYISWLQGVAATGTFVKKVGTEWSAGNDYIPTGWTVIEE